MNRKTGFHFLRNSLLFLMGQNYLLGLMFIGYEINFNGSERIVLLSRLLIENLKEKFLTFYLDNYGSPWTVKVQRNFRD